MELDFGAILGRAWRITWNYKVLWIFGILASLGGGGGGNPNVNYQFDNSSRANLPPEMQRYLDRLDPAMLIAIALGFICLMLIVFLVFVALSVIGRGGLISGIQAAETGGQVTFSTLWSEGVRRFVTLFLIGLVANLVPMVLGTIVGVGAFIVTIFTLGIGLICLAPVFCLLAIVSIIVSIIGYFAQIAAVVGNLSVGEAFRRSWEMIRSHPGPIIILGIILAVIGAIVSAITFIPLGLIVLPALLAIGGFASESQAAGTAGLAIALACCAAYTPVLLVVGGVLQTWTTASWTLTYRQFMGPAAPAGAPSAPGMVLP